MSTEQTERATSMLYEDASVREELTDDEAGPLLKWGEAQIAALAARALDDEAFDEQYEHLRKFMLRVNRLVGRRVGMSAEDQTEMLTKIGESAESLGAPIPADKIAAFRGGQFAMSNAAAIQALTALLNLAAKPAASATQISGGTGSGGLFEQLGSLLRDAAQTPDAEVSRGEGSHAAPDAGTSRGEGSRSTSDEHSRGG
jgi:hypothetical protein